MATSRSRTVIAWTLMVVGALMAVQWLVFLGTGSVPELHAEPLAIGFHLAAEAAAAALLVIAGVGLLRSRGAGPHRALVALGMLLYTVINSAGYFAERAQWGMVAMFGVLLVVAIAAAATLITSAQPSRSAESSPSR